MIDTERLKNLILEKDAKIKEQQETVKQVKKDCDRQIKRCEGQIEKYKRLLRRYEDRIKNSKNRAHPTKKYGPGIKDRKGKNSIVQLYYTMDLEQVRQIEETVKEMYELQSLYNRRRSVKEVDARTVMFYILFYDFKWGFYDISKYTGFYHMTISRLVKQKDRCKRLVPVIREIRRKYELL